MQVTSLSAWTLMMTCFCCLASGTSKRECQVRCPQGTGCVVLPDSNLHLCVHQSSYLLTGRGSGQGSGRGSGSSSRGVSGRQGAGLAPEGRGDPSCPRLPVPGGPCVEQCVFNSDCLHDQACCSTGCGNICTNVQPVSKPGSCPLPSQLTSEPCGAQCQVDGQCPAHSKCCRSPCGMSCQAPCFHWLAHHHVNHSQRWRLSHRCNPAHG